MQLIKDILTSPVLWTFIGSTAVLVSPFIIVDALHYVG